MNWNLEMVSEKRLIDVLKQALYASPDLRIYVMTQKLGRFSPLEEPIKDN